jgi:DNA-binding transcriptional LysR family regulator
MTPFRFPPDAADRSVLSTHSVTRLIFINGVLGGSWDALTQGRADILSVHCMSPQLSDFGFARLGVLEQVFAVAPHHPLAEPEPLNRRVIKGYRAIVVGTALAGMCASQLLDEQEAITVFDFKTKLELQISGLGCGYFRAIWRSALLTAARLLKNRYLLKAVMNRCG